jgi:hypothetical protein
VTYLLDTNIVAYFLEAGREGDLAAAAKRCPMTIVGEVRTELEKNKDRGGRFFTQWLATSSINVHTINVGSPASSTLAQLRKLASSRKDLGERASIALIASDPSLTLVSNDKGAMWLSLRELWKPGERILGLAPSLRRLFEQRALEDPAVLDEVMAIRSTAAQRPTWWASWRASLASRPSEA